jgi:hypothetical protein
VTVLFFIEKGLTTGFPVACEKEMKGTAKSAIENPNDLFIMIIVFYRYYHM